MNSKKGVIFFYLDILNRSFFSRVEQLLMRWQLSMLKGEADKASLICQKVKSSFDSYTPVVKARVCIMEAESACLVKDFTSKNPK